MSDHPTLLTFLEQSDLRVQVYDIGRRIGVLPREVVIGFEQCETPYPRPMQRKAWIALVQVPRGEATQPVIWFLRLDLDEQGLLVQAERDYLLSRLLESAQAQSQGADPQVFLRDNPYAFSPREDRMAVFHARLSADLGMPPSRFYAHALDYFHGRPGWDQWSFVGYQGIADVACRHADEPLSQAIAQLPDEPLIALAHCLESGHPGQRLRDALIARLDRALAEAEPSIALVAALVRGLSGRTDDGAVADALQGLLQHRCAVSIEVLAALSGRAWEALENPSLLNAFLARLAENDHGQPAFAQCVADLLSLPTLATSVRAALREPGQATAVRAAFGKMLDSGDAPPPR